MKPILITGVSVAANTAGLANNVGGTSGTAFVLAANDAADDLGHKVIVTNNSATDYSGGGKTIALVGTNPGGEPQTETLTGPGSSVTSTSTKYWKSLTSATPNFTLGGGDTFDIGWTAGSASPWHFLNDNWQPPGMGFGTSVDSGSPTYGVEQQYGDGVAFTHATVTAETTAQEGGYTYPVRAIRLIWTAAGGVTLRAWY